MRLPFYTTNKNPLNSHKFTYIFRFLWKSLFDGKKTDEIRTYKKVISFIATLNYTKSASLSNENENITTRFPI